MKAFVFLPQIQPFPTLLFLVLTAWNANVITGGAATILQQKGEKHEHKSLILGMAEVENIKAC